MEYDALKQPDRITHEYNMLMSSMHVSVGKHLLDPYFTVIWANDFFYEKTGYGREEYEATFHNHVSEYYSAFPDVYETMGKFIKTALKHGEPSYEFVCPMPVKGGSRIWIKVVGTFTKEMVDGIPVIYSVFTDITDLVQAQTEKSITYDNLPGFIAKFQIRAGCAQERFTFLDANDRFIDFFGARAAGDAPYSLVNWDSARNQQALNEHYPAMREGKPVHFTVQAKTLQNDDAWLQLNGDCIDVIQGDPVYLFIYIDITDITEQKVLQKKLEERSELLRNALEMAERANRAKSDFLSRMSHDIRTPMNAIMGMLSIAKESWDDPDRVWDCLDKVENSARFLLALINDILDMSKIESGKAILKKKAFDFAAFTRNLAAMFYGQAEKKQVRFQVLLGRSLAEAYVGDELKLNQILINLLGNAIKFTEPGGSVLLSVQEDKRSNKASELVFTVTDTGIGMEKSFLKKIFEPFEQDSQQRSNQGGSGLGLSIAEKYARMMNGGIEVDSAPGKGSTFVARIWLENDEAQAPVSLEERFRHLKALVVDADAEELEYTCSLLFRFGVAAEGFASGDMALERLDAAVRQGESDIIVLVDWGNARPAADALIRQIRKSVEENGPVIAVAAYDWSAIKVKALEAGADVFLQKPLFASTLYDLLLSLTQDRPLACDANPEEGFDGERVLLVEDNALNLEIAVTLLTTRKLQVDTARNGQEAVEKFRGSEAGYYLAILMDIQMPIMDGLEATRRIRSLAHDDAERIPIIAMSADAFEDDVEKSLEAGMNAHISKPVDIPALFTTLRQIKDKRA